MIKSFFLAISLLFFLSACHDTKATNNNQINDIQTVDDSLLHVFPVIDSAEITVESRFGVPHGFERTNTDDPFAMYLRSLELHPIEYDVHYYDGSTKSREGVYCSVVKLPIGKRDRHQCADAVMNVRAHYFYNSGQFDKIQFNFTNGFRADYSKWRNGKRIRVSGNDVSYYQTSQESTSYASFLSYLQKVYCYAGTYSLSKELVSVDLDEIQPGHVFIKGGFPGHAVLVLDVIADVNGNKKFMLAQSYMPAQDLQILINPNSDEFTPWYNLNDIGNEIYTPEWIFSKDQLKKFANE